MPLTRLQIIDEALEQAGLDSGYRSKGRNWLNIILEKLSKRTNYRGLRKTADVVFVAGQLRHAVPTDFQRIDTLYYVDAAGNQSYPISIKEPYEAEAMRTLGAGFPSSCWVDQNTNELVFNSAPGVVTTEKYRIGYFKTAPQYSLDNTDDAVIPVFDDEWTLLEEMKALAYEWSEDAREMQKKGEARQSSKDYQRNMYQSDSNSIVPLNQELFRKRHRRP